MWRETPLVRTLRFTRSVYCFFKYIYLTRNCVGLYSKLEYYELCTSLLPVYLTGKSSGFMFHVYFTLLYITLHFGAIICKREDYLFLYLFIYLFISLSVYLPIYFFICLSTYLFLYLFIYLFISLSVYLPIYFFICLSTYLFLYLFIYLFISLSFIYLFISLSVYLPIYFFICLSTYLYMIYLTTPQVTSNMKH
jgi:hypothetical protein